jgi:hypothetical protein
MEVPLIYPPLKASNSFEAQTHKSMLLFPANQGVPEQVKIKNLEETSDKSSPRKVCI